MAFVPELVELADKTLRIARQLENAPDWTSQGVVSDVNIFSRPYESSSIAMVKGVRVVKGSPKQLATTFFKLTAPGKLSEWDETFVLYEIFDEILGDPSFTITVDYMISSLPWPVWGRDFVIVNGQKFDDNRIIQYQTSCLHPDRPERPKEYVRGDITISVFIFESADGGTIETSQMTKITRILHVDPKGIIPAWVINSVSNKQTSDIINNIATLNVQN